VFYGDPKLTLARFMAVEPAAAVRFSCAGCGAGYDVSAREVIWLLKAYGWGDELSTVAEAGRLARNPCVRCGGSVWDAWPLPPKPGGASA
jgi:hypothetical protein